MTLDAAIPSAHKNAIPIRRCERLLLLHPRSTAIAQATNRITRTQAGILSHIGVFSELEAEKLRALS
jgi:hypothetical protein